MDDITFYHHGIKGQKWGLRRFQNKDGSLTNAGRKRYSDDGGSSEPKKQNRSLFSRKTSVKKKSSTSSKSDSKKDEEMEKKTKTTKVETLDGKSKTISEMSDQELQSAINRIRMEQTYLSMIQSKTPVTPERKNRGKEFVNKFIDEAIIPAAVGAGKNVLQKYIEKAANSALGLSTPQAKTAYQALKEQSDMLNFQVNIRNQKEKLKEKPKTS